MRSLNREERDEEEDTGAGASKCLREEKRSKESGNKWRENDGTWGGKLIVIKYSAGTKSPQIHIAVAASAATDGESVCVCVGSKQLFC